MSYENHKCPCGNRKERQTMLCSDCVTAFADRPELTAYMDPTLSLDYRRQSAYVLVALAKKRRSGHGLGKRN